jgi:hypothetical protein
MYYNNIALALTGLAAPGKHGTTIVSSLVCCPKRFRLGLI